MIRRIVRHAAVLVAAAASVFSASWLFAAGEVPPPPTRWVTDGASFLSEPARQALDARLEAYERQTGHQVLVWIDRTTAGVPIEDFAVKAFKAWGVGRRGQDDGLVLFIFADDRTARFEVGYGLEGAFPDISASRVIREILAPKLQAGDPDGAVAAAIDAATATISGDESASGLRGPGPQERRGRGQPRPLTTAQKVVIGIAAIGFLLLLISNPSLALFLLQVIASGGGGRGGGGGGGGWSGGGGRSGGGGASGSW